MEFTDSECSVGHEHASGVGSYGGAIHQWLTWWLKETFIYRGSKPLHTSARRQGWCQPSRLPRQAMPGKPPPSHEFSYGEYDWSPLPGGDQLTRLPSLELHLGGCPPEQTVYLNESQAREVWFHGSPWPSPCRKCRRDLWMRPRSLDLQLGRPPAPTEDPWRRCCFTGLCSLSLDLHIGNLPAAEDGLQERRAMEMGVEQHATASFPPLQLPPWLLRALGTVNGGTEGHSSTLQACSQGDCLSHLYGSTSSARRQHQGRNCGVTSCHWTTMDHCSALEGLLCSYDSGVSKDQLHQEILLLNGIKLTILDYWFFCVDCNMNTHLPSTDIIAMCII